MAEIKWIKLNTDMFDNRKIKYIRTLPEGNNIILIWVMLLTMAGRCNSGGMIFLTENIPYDTKMLADELGFEENIVKIAIASLEKLSMVSTYNGRLFIPGWNEYQNSESLDRIREQTKNRVQKYRENQKKITGNVTGNVTVTQCNATEEDKEIDKEEDNIKESKKKKFTPPSVQEVQVYLDAVGSIVDAEAFVAFYNSKDWMVGRNKMKNWKSAIVTWEKRDGLGRVPPKKPEIQAKIIEEEPEISPEEFERMMKAGEI